MVGLALLLIVGCSKPWPVDTPPPPVQPAPDGLKVMAIHVHQHKTPAETAQDEWDYHNMPGLTAELRRAVIMQLQRAGYTVVVDRMQPHDVVAVVQADWPNDHDGTATLVLENAGQPIATFSARIPIIGTPPRTEHLEATAAVYLVDKISGSQDVRAFADVVRGHHKAVIAQ